ncbi:MAG: ferredoxin family protein [Acidobacteria bacterium]|nr:ferredoxin family protein [Acidobacteriota bacterium]
MSGAGALSLPVLRVALYEGRGAEPLDGAQRFAVMQTLLDRGYRVTRVGAGGAAAPARADDGNALAVLGRFTERQPGEAVADSGGRVWFRDIAGATADGVAAVVDAIRGECEVREPGAWKPWFPVIDFDRCTNCMQCLSFCLFDVYGVSKGGQIQVQNHDNCKTDCPACSRVCPEVAILFPKYRHGPIHGGEIQADDVRREAMKVDISALLGGDIYAALRDRSAKAKSRFSKERDEERALKERQKCLVKLQENLDIPAEVLASLPSLEDIQAKAEAAKARAQAAVDAAAAAARQEG